MSDAILSPTVFAGLDGVVAGFTTRAFAPADELREATRQRLSEATGFEHVASVGQVHRADVATVASGGHTPEHDGLVTDRAGVLLTTVAADCALVLLADPASGVVGACHSGWRGTVAGVLTQTVAAMDALGADARGLRAYVGPCISAERFEVGEEVAEQFSPEVVVRRPVWPRPHVDLKAELARQLRTLGVAEAHTEIADGCTMTETDRFYSYRAEGGTPGRMLGFIGRRA
ncbi:MAG: polyphenol oxidase family protein [Bacteroidota bacterium]